MLYFTDPLRCRRAEEHAATFGRGGYVYEVELVGGKRFDPLNDPVALEIANAWLAPRSLWGWSPARIPYEAAVDIVEVAAPLGYEVYEFYESAWRCWSVAVLESAAPRLLRIVGER